MKHYESKNRSESLERLIPELFKHKSVLYIGAKAARFDFGEEFKAANYDISILEVYYPNIKFLKSVPFLKEVIHGDVRTFTSDKKYDFVFWWHGPEHIEEVEVRETLERLKQYANIALVVGCPWGKYEQGEDEGNPFEVHVSHLNYPLFEELGFEVECLGIENVPGSNLTAVYKINK